MKREWINRHPIVVINLLFVALISFMFFYQAFRPLDVLQDWTLSLTGVREYRVIDGERYPVYHPGEVLTFKSSSVKLVDARGTTSRVLICQPTPAQEEREIQLDIIPATKPAGYSEPRENGIVLPDVAQYDGLPRTCRLIINVVYENVALWRNHTESARTEPFIVEEVRYTPAQLKAEIDRLKQRIKDLEAQQITYAPAQTENKQSVYTPPSMQAEPSEQEAPSTPKPQEKGIFSSVIDTVDNALKGLLGR